LILSKSKLPGHCKNCVVSFSIPPLTSPELADCSEPGATPHMMWTQRHDIQLARVRDRLVFVQNTIGHFRHQASLMTQQADNLEKYVLDLVVQRACVCERVCKRVHLTLAAFSFHVLGTTTPQRKYQETVAEMIPPQDPPPGLQGGTSSAPSTLGMPGMLGLPKTCTPSLERQQERLACHLLL
jgi:hypothetical protein